MEQGPLSGLQTFEVALWRRWREGELPAVDVVEAAHAWEAVEMVMWEQGWTAVGHACAFALDGFLQYRAYGVRLAPLAVRDRYTEELVHQEVMRRWQRRRADASVPDPL